MLDVTYTVNLRMNQLTDKRSQKARITASGLRTRLFSRINVNIPYKIVDLLPKLVISFHLVRNVIIIQARTLEAQMQILPHGLTTLHPYFRRGTLINQA